MTNFEFPEPPQSSEPVVEVWDQKVDYERNFQDIMTRLPQDIYAFRSDAQSPEVEVSEDVSLPIAQSETVHVVSESEGQVSIEFPAAEEGDPVTAVVYEDAALKFRHDDQESVFKPDAEGVAAAYQVFSVLQASLIARESGDSEES